MMLGKLGEQVVLISERSVAAITKTEIFPADRREYYANYCEKDRMSRENYKEITSHGFSADELFVIDLIRVGVRNGDLRFVAGLSGAELACLVIESTVGEHPSAIDGTFTISPEYWTAWVLAYSLWKSGGTFRFISNKGLTIEEIIALNHPLHEADLDKFGTVADRIIEGTVKTSISPLKKARERYGLTREELSQISGISLRMIRAIDQKSQDIAKANFKTVSRLETVLHTDFSDI